MQWLTEAPTIPDHGEKAEALDAADDERNITVVPAIVNHGGPQQGPWNLRMATCRDECVLCGFLFRHHALLGTIGRIKLGISAGGAHGDRPDDAATFDEGQEPVDERQWCDVDEGHVMAQGPRCGIHLASE
jgi:hypothetical protein